MSGFSDTLLRKARRATRPEQARNSQSRIAGMTGPTDQTMACSSGVARAEVRAAIVGAYNRATFDRLLLDRFDFRRAVHVADGPFTDIVDGVFDRFVEEGREAYLIAEIAADRPAKPEIQAIYRKYAQALLSDAWRERVEPAMCDRLARYGLLPSPELLRAGAGCRGAAPGDTAPNSFAGFQRQIRAELPELDVLQWSALLMRQTCRVCRVELDGVALGTGFLVGPAAVLTSHHVVRDAIAARISGAALTFLFDYWKAGTGASAVGTRIAARPTWTQWHVDSSPPLSRSEEHTGAAETRPDRLDHAVIALDQTIGNAPVASGGPIRGWIEIPSRPPALTVGMPIAILHHPRTTPIKLTLDTRGLQQVNAQRTRIRYTTNTDAGSSGSPCFNLELGLVGIHQFSDPEHAVPEYNQGVAIEAIYRRLAEQGKLGVLGGEVP